jgi:hypothetical protein
VDVGVSVGVSDATGVSVDVGVSVGVSDATGVSVDVGVSVGVAVSVGVSVEVGVSGGVSAPVSVSVAVGVGDSVCRTNSASVGTWSAGWKPSCARATAGATISPIRTTKTIAVLGMSLPPVSKVDAWLESTTKRSSPMPRV